MRGVLADHFGCRAIRTVGVDYSEVAFLTGSVASGIQPVHHSIASTGYGHSIECLVEFGLNSNRSFVSVISPGFQVLYPPSAQIIGLEGSDSRAYQVNLPGFTLSQPPIR